MKETCYYPKCGCLQFRGCIRKERKLTTGTLSYTTLTDEDLLEAIRKKDAENKKLDKYRNPTAEELTVKAGPSNTDEINSIQFRSLAIFHIQELEDRIKELEGKLEFYRKETSKLREYVETNKIQGL